MKKFRQIYAWLVFRQRMLVASLTAMMLLASPSAHAFKLSSISGSWTTELSAGTKFVLLGIAACGIGYAGWSVIRWMQASNRGEPARGVVAGVIGGAAAVVIPFIILMLAGSLTNESGGAQQMFNDLNIQY